MQVTSLAMGAVPVPERQSSPERAANSGRFDPSLAVPLTWFDRPTLDVAQALLGMILVSVVDGELVAGVLVEVEAYGGPDDPASHAARYRNGPVQAMWGPPGHAYVYRAYGVYPCCNVVTEPEGRAGAVLLRGAAPLVGLEVMRARRQAMRPGQRLLPDERLASGPGALAIAFGIGLEHNGIPLDRPPVWLQPGGTPERVVSTPRIGISRGQHLLWRFVVADHPAVSRRGHVE
ncbi:DNA-3-methyladenine glycosylase [Thermomicrobium sp. 4228-Ro]|uniref:DNA-3-methyladenine glycosylase n=1 Tax=Thermomicrobium sp. 4228-Ro TaxID=2993937 RepID=UPI0022494C70|nr:DNA-3-methyladenine glycosylase [Thermomicrobium sp. 4228-Ro]MCX2726713.1 DNA-3-methyladenine glycosylase [Thermomicrobium sp. 4228-Ro]